MAYETTDHETAYCFPDVNSSCVRLQRSTEEYNLMYVFFSLLSVWTVFLNLLVIISISHFKKLHTPTNLLILSLAVADLLVGLIVIPVEAIKFIEMCWYFGVVFCGLYTMMLSMLLSASLGNLVLIAIDRYVAVGHPLQYPQKITLTRTIVCICLSWFFSWASGTAFAFNDGFFGKEHSICYGDCTLFLSLDWIVTDLFLSFLLPCAFIITLYLRIFYVVHQQVKVINSIIKQSKHENENLVKRKSERKAALTLGIIVMVYLLCWIPYYICSLWLTSVKTLNILTWAVFVCSGLNPLVYALFYSWFKKSIKHILTLKIFQPSSSLIDFFTDH